jgi:hypothetical protein
MAEDKETLASVAKAAVRTEAIQQSAKWVIGGAVALVGFAAVGWWFYFKPSVIDTLGGVPRGAVMAFDRDDLTEDTCPIGWVPFLEARAHVIVGAGDPAKSPGKMRYDERQKLLQGYVLRQHGGEQTYADFSTFQPLTGVSPHSNVFPYLALYYCKKS